MKLNNKGFAITAVLYGLLILFVILVSSYLLVLSAKKDRVDSLISDIEKSYEPSDKQKLSDYIISLYKNNNPTQITQASSKNKYYYASSANLMNDGLDNVGEFITDTNVLISGISGNIRYYGNTPSNYVYFNCTDYNNQNSTSCELWRIIGVFDGKVKIMRNDSIGKYVWNYSSSGEIFKNNWYESTLQKLLNEEYYNNSNGVSFYNGSSQSITINFETDKKGIKNDKTRNMISESTWYLGGHTTANIYPNDIYKYEHGDTIGSNTSKLWNGKVGLIYISDYGYASDLSDCKSKLDYYDSNFDGNNYYSSQCYETNWIFNGQNQWTITPDVAGTFSVFLIRSTGAVGYGGGYSIKNDYNIFPTVYLNENTFYIDGYGTEENPFQIG